MIQEDLGHSCFQVCKLGNQRKVNATRFCTGQRHTLGSRRGIKVNFLFDSCVWQRPLLGILHAMSFFLILNRDPEGSVTVVTRMLPLQSQNPNPGCSDSSLCCSQWPGYLEAEPQDSRNSIQIPQIDAGLSQKLQPLTLENVFHYQSIQQESPAAQGRP